MELSDEASSNEDFARAYTYLDMAEEMLPDRPEIKHARRFVGIRELSYEQEQRRQTPFDQERQRERDQAAAQEAFIKEQLARAQRSAQRQPYAGGMRWGAIAYSQNGAFGSGYDFPNATEAESRALAECGTHDVECEVKATFNDCGALADAQDGAWGWASRPNLLDAKAAAIAACQGYTNARCEVRTGFCANGSMR